MYSTTDEQGLINNFAKETKPYYAKDPSQQQQRRYAIQGVFAALLVSTLIFVSFAVS
ncbi:MAG: ssl1498 family light-harvesting-like protein [Oscillatoria sp. PMC 1051.18]|uniref:photosystem II assembly protein Psb34 n=1 Tax=Oscillatoria salina TaxID=331517 RepID=UPI0013B617D2|nr:ssl1498 family light-harvesting-like protein [Oscillatoria salina]MBZ8180572.1 ssl1498 family light-harvesting-like protein [Oscillatoria salina IIICB1]MEC4894805.1 ssl1498 family light-harvesting-like protein [Oscillatoria sp. PMC 1050.18]MEC5031343.1 ssl1498 family light-harvesting-like protein [Oscillatoria sp. PMC 1051.18]NET90309.1 ssl1498 family light-harvesting-like protein [Kamptonema sp. SIO1D9]